MCIQILEFDICNKNKATKYWYYCNFCKEYSLQYCYNTVHAYIYWRHHLYSNTEDDSLNSGIYTSTVGVFLIDDPTDLA